MPSRPLQTEIWVSAHARMNAKKVAPRSQSGVGPLLRLLFRTSPLAWFWFELASPHVGQLLAGPLLNAPFVSCATGTYPTGVAVGDVNGDGVRDLIVGNSFSPTLGVGSLSLIPGRRGGSFGKGTEIPLGFGPQAVASGDLNWDCCKDLIATDPEGNRVRVVLSDGNGGWAGTDYATGGSPYGVVARDFDGDIVQDMAVSNSASNTVSVFLGTGDGAFGPRADYPVGTVPTFLASGDFNGDGAPDLAVANTGANSVTVLLGNGDGTFSFSSESATGTYPISLAVADLNRDGHADLTCANTRDSTISVLMGKGDGHFEPKTDYHTDSAPRALVAGNLDSDAWPDVAVAGGTYYGSGSLLMFLNRGDGTLIRRPSFGSLSFPQSMALADLNGDHRLDVAVVNHESNEVSVYFGNGNGTFGVDLQWAVGGSPRSVVVQDLDGDGRRDIIVANAGSNTVSVLPNDGHGGFGPRTDYATGPYPHAVAVGDVTHDGIPDLAVANYTGPILTILTGRGDGTFGGRRDIQFSSSVNGVAIADINTDGFPDVAATYSDSVSILFGGADGSLAARTTFVDPGVFVAGALAMADFNRDAKPDLAIASDDYYLRVDVFLGNGDGTFAHSAYCHTKVAPMQIAVADLNGDGLSDFVASGPSGCFPPIECWDMSAVAFFPGNGQGGFGEPIWLGTELRPTGLAVGDINSDGWPDLAVAASGSNTTSLLLASAYGFASAEHFGVGRGPNSLAVADMDGDGFDDVVVANTASNTVSLLLNGRRVLDTPTSAPLTRLALEQSFPNPAHENPLIRFTLPRDQPVSLKVFDPAGRLVARLVGGLVAAGEHVVQWDRRTTRGVKAPPGVYFYELLAGRERITRRLVLLQ